MYSGELHQTSNAGYSYHTTQHIIFILLLLSIVLCTSFCMYHVYKDYYYFFVLHDMYDPCNGSVGLRQCHKKAAHLPHVLEWPQKGLQHGPGVACQGGVTRSPLARCVLLCSQQGVAGVQWRCVHLSMDVGVSGVQQPV